MNAERCRDALGDAHDEPDTGVPPCIFCRREIPCECGAETCMCSCGRCMAPGLPDWPVSHPGRTKA